MGENIHELLYLCECGNYRHYKNGKFCCQCGREINRERKNALAEQIEILLEQWELENGRNYIKSEETGTDKLHQSRKELRYRNGRTYFSEK